MRAVRAFFLGLREVFLLEAAERRAREIDDVERGRRQRFSRAVRTRRALARRSAQPAGAIVLLRDALELALRGTHPEAEFELARILAASHLPTRSPHATSRVIELIALPGPLAIDDLAFAEAESFRDALEDCVAAALCEARAPSPRALRAMRFGRAAGVLVLVVWLVGNFVRGHFLVHNVALDKTVTSSALRGESPTPDHVVDGKTRGTFGIATVDTEHPFVQIDLGGSDVLDHAVVYNRGDGWFDDSLPLVLSVSEDGVHFEDVARRDEHFDVWRVELGQRRARFVRVSMPTRGYIALNEIEVYGRAVR